MGMKFESKYNVNASVAVHIQESEYKMGAVTKVTPVADRNGVKIKYLITYNDATTEADVEESRVFESESAFKEWRIQQLQNEISDLRR